MCASGQRADCFGQDAVKHDRLKVMRLKRRHQFSSRRVPDILLVEHPNDETGVQPNFGCHALVTVIESFAVGQRVAAQ